ncbi:MAG: ABC transporter permease [Desulfotignum sp.]|nr:ABC transporter permease [Desulfotignum sp.]MCF8125130.1 ABC transporter permease [Desulfotignum sp.]
MNSARTMADLGPVRPPTLYQRIFSVWLRHVRVYTRHLISNGFPPFVEPLIFLAGIGLGLGSYVGLIDGKTYIMFLASGIIVPPAMFTATFECTFGTFIRLEFDKVYDGMISASLTVKDMFIGEILFAGTKGFFFSCAVLTVIAGFGLVESGMAVFTPFIGFITGLMFAALALFVTSFVKNINHFNFFFTGVVTPMFFFSGIVFPLDNLPEFARWIAALFPLMHAVRLVRAFCFNSFDPGLFFNLAYMIIFIALFGSMAIKRLKKRIVN